MEREREKSVCVCVSETLYSKVVRLSGTVTSPCHTLPSFHVRRSACQV
jgi:hypothetical protein